MTVMVLPLLQPLFLCHFSQFLAFVLQLPPLASVFPLLLLPHPFVAVPAPFFLPPSNPSSAEYLLLCPPAQIQELCQ